MDDANQSHPGAADTGSSASGFGRIVQFVVQKPHRAAQIVFFLLVAIIVLQNLESTSIDVLFWTIAAMPKLVLIFLSMIVGAVAWEMARRLMR